MSNKSSTEHQNRRKAENRCVRCGKLTSEYITSRGEVKRYTLCAEHRRYHRTYYLEKIRKG